MSRCPDDAGRLVRRLRREMGSLWVFLNESGVEPTNNRAERALRFGVLWRKGSLGTASAKGNDWVQRSLSLRQTCRQLEQSTFSVLVDALEAFMHDRPPDLSWLRWPHSLLDPLNAYAESTAGEHTRNLSPFHQKSG